MRTPVFARGRFPTAVRCAIAMWLAVAGLWVVAMPNADAAGTRAFTADFGITDNVFADPSGPVVVGRPIPVDIVIIDNDASCVAPAFASCVVPTGTVTIFAKDAAANITTLGSAPLSPTPAQPGRSGQAVFSFPETLPAGDYTVYGSYSGDATFAASTSGIGFVVLAIDQATPTLTLTQPASSSPVGIPLTFHATVSFPNTAAAGDPPQPAAPTGTVSLETPAGTIATASLDATGTGTFHVTAPATVTTLTLHAEYSGDSNLLPASSPALEHQVVQLAPSTSLTAAPSTVTVTTPARTITPASTPASATPTSTSGSGVGLATTGSDTLALAGLGAGLLIIGAGVLMLTRRRAHLARHVK